MPSLTPFNFEKFQVEHALEVLTNGNLMLDKAPFPDESRPFTKLCQDWLALEAERIKLLQNWRDQTGRADAERDSASRATEEMISLKLENNTLRQALVFCRDHHGTKEAWEKVIEVLKPKGDS